MIVKRRSVAQVKSMNTSWKKLVEEHWMGYYAPFIQACRPIIELRCSRTWCSVLSTLVNNFYISSHSKRQSEDTCSSVFHLNFSCRRENYERVSPENMAQLKSLCLAAGPTPGPVLDQSTKTMDINRTTACWSSHAWQKKHRLAIDRIDRTDWPVCKDSRVHLSNCWITWPTCHPGVTCGVVACILEVAKIILPQIDLRTTVEFKEGQGKNDDAKKLRQHLWSFWFL